MKQMEEDTTFASLEIWDENGKYSLACNIDDNNRYYMPHFEIYSSPLPIIPQNLPLSETLSVMNVDMEIPEIWDNEDFLFKSLYPTCKLYVKFGKTLPPAIFSERVIREYNKKLYDITETIPKSDLINVFNIFEKFFKMCKQFNLSIDNLEIPLLDDKHNEDQS